MPLTSAKTGLPQVAGRRFAVVVELDLARRPSAMSLCLTPSNPHYLWRSEKKFKASCSVRANVTTESSRTWNGETQLKPSPVELGGRLIMRVTYEIEVGPFWQALSRKGR
eukprot:3708381-Prymnesium_polylepis.1